MAVVSIKLEGQDNVSDKIKRVEKNLGDLGKNAGREIDLGDVTGALGQLGSVEGALGLLGSALPVAGLGIAAAAAGGAAWELGKLGAEAQRTSQSYENLASRAGISASAMLSAMREASQGTVADSELMLAANRALVLGVADNAEEMAKLVGTAISKGREVGVGAAQAVSDLITGIGRMSPEILDNLGIAGVKGAFDEYATSLGKTVDQLTEVERKQALVNAVLRDAPTKVIDDAAASFERMDASIQNAKESLGVLFSPAIAAIAENVANAAKFSTDALKVGPNQGYAALGKMVTESMSGTTSELEAISEKLRQNQVDLAEAIRMRDAYLDPKRVGGPQVDLAAQLGPQIAALTAENGRLQAQRNTIALAEATATANAQAWNGVSAWQTFGSSVQQSAAFLQWSQGVMVGVKSELAALAGQAAATGNSLRQAWIGAAGALGASQAFAGWKEQEKQLEALRQGWNYMGLTSQEIQFRESEFLDQNNNKIASQIKLIEDSTTAVSAHGGAVSAVNQQYSELASKVSGALQGATSLDPIGVNPTDYLPRADAVQEDAFRLADVMVRGFDSPWAQYFQSTFPKMWEEITAGGDIQAGAARVLQQFQEGMRPELLNFDQLKETVKSQLLSEQAFAGMAQQLTDQLVAELGVSAGQVQGALAGVVGGLPGGQQIAQQVGPTDMTQTGSDAGVTFTAGFSASVNGATLVATITAQMAGALGAFDANGRTAGAKWAGGFYASVESGMAPQLINLLVTLVTPGVLAQLQDQKTQTGTSDGSTSSSNVYIP